jgi:ADP-heptose:LPS heptosyltransferase
MKVLFITSTRIGDAVLSTSILNYLKNRFPHCSLYIATGKTAASLFKNFNNIKKIFILEKKFFKIHWLELWSRTFFNKWDIVIDLRGSIISYFLFNKKKYVYKSINKNIHRLDELAILMETKHLPLPWIPVLKKDMKKISKDFLKLKNSIAIGASANWPAKIWPSKNFVKLIHMFLKEKQFGKKKSIVFFGSSKDLKNIKKITKHLKKIKVKNLCGKLNLIEVAAHLKKCKIFIGNDSGLMHIASASGIPTLGLFGPSLESRYAPKGNNSYYIRTKKTFNQLTGAKNFDWNTKKNLMSSLSVNAVFNKIKKILTSNN